MIPLSGSFMKQEMKALFPGKMVLGLTGGVGSGKSMVMGFLRESFGAFTIEADKVCAALIEKDGSSFEDMLSLMGSEILDQEGAIDRSKMSRLIFSDSTLREKVNQILHPATFEAARALIEATDSPLIVYESAIPRQARLKELCHRVLYVYTPLKLRISRLEEARGYSPEKTKAIMASQPDHETYRSLSDATLYNGRSQKECFRRLKAIMKEWGVQEQK